MFLCLNILKPFGQFQRNERYFISGRQPNRAQLICVNFDRNWNGIKSVVSMKYFLSLGRVALAREPS